MPVHFSLRLPVPLNAMISKVMNMYSMHIWPMVTGGSGQASVIDFDMVPDEPVARCKMIECVPAWTATIVLR